MTNGQVEYTVWLCWTKGDSHLGWEVSSHYSEQQFKTYEVLISGIFHLVFSDHSWLWITETAESKTEQGGTWLTTVFTTNCWKNTCGKTGRLNFRPWEQVTAKVPAILIACKLLWGVRKGIWYSDRKELKSPSCLSIWLQAALGNSYFWCFRLFKISKFSKEEISLFFHFIALSCQ